ncbi:MAG TPA: VTT domain-containing protein [Nannocystaceae bacterium]|nr:VTT domain-containing protein [Nannocystaceae bacterium]
MQPPPTRRWPKVVVGLVVLAAAIALLTSDLHGSLSPIAIRERVLSWGMWGPVAFLVAFTVLQPFGVSAHVFIVAATLVWSPVTSLVLSWSGALFASASSFWFARWMGREWVQARLPARLQRWDEKLATHGFRTVLVMRLLLFTFGPMQLMLGVSQVRFVPYLLASALGLFPMIALESFVGASVVGWLFE